MGRSIQGAFNPLRQVISPVSLTGSMFQFLGEGTFAPRPADMQSYIDAALIPSNLTDWAGNTEEHEVTFAGTFRKPYVKVRGNIRVNATSPHTVATLTIRVNGVETACKVKIPELTNGFILGEGEVTFSANDTIDGVIDIPEQNTGDPGYSGNDIGIIGFWCEMDTDDGHFGVHRIGVEGWGERVSAIAGPGDIRYSDTIGGGTAGRSFMTAPLGGSNAYNLSTEISSLVNATPPFAATISSRDPLLEPNQQIVRAPGSFDSGQLYLSGNDAALADQVRATEWALLVDGVDDAPFWDMDNTSGAQTLGRLDGFAGPRIVTNGQLISYGVYVYQAPDAYNLVSPLSLASGNIAAEHWAINVASDDTRLDIFQSMAFRGETNAATGVPATKDLVGAVGPVYAAIFGGSYWFYVSDTTDHADVSIRPPSCTKFTRLRMYCGVYSGDPVTVSIAKDGVATGVTILINGTGWFEDTTHSAFIGPLHDVSLRFDVADGDTFSGALYQWAVTQEQATTECDEAGVCNCDPECEGAITFCSLKLRTLRMLGEDPAAPVYWTADEIGRYINDSYVAACRDTKALEYIEGIALSADSEAATLSDYVGQIFRVTFDDRKIDNVTKYELDRTKTNWESLAGFVSNYVTTLQNNRTIATYKAWDGTTYNAEELFFNDGAYTYAAHANATDYVIGDRVTRTAATTPFFGKTFAYSCILAHTSSMTTAPGTDTMWQTYWVPIALMVWCIKNPAILEDCDVPELPPWTHLAICFEAAARALGKKGEMRNEQVAQAYRTIASDYWTTLRGIIGNRTPEKLTAMGRGSVPRRPRPWDQVIVP